MSAASTPPAHNANRLTPDDEQAIRARMADTVRTWRLNTVRPGDGWVWPVAAKETLIRVGLGAIGCTPLDMRDVEMVAVEACAVEFLTATR